VTLGLIWAQAVDRVIGNAGGMPWRLPEDARHFREVTSGATVVMGRRTWESLPVRFRPLPNRRNLVVTRDPEWHGEGAEVFASVDAAIDAAARGRQSDVVWVIGGGELYAATIDRADILEVTEIDERIPGDTSAPEIDRRVWQRVDVDPDEAWATSSSGLRYRFARFTRFAS